MADAGKAGASIFVPTLSNKSHCADMPMNPSWPISLKSSYILKASTGSDDYPKLACPPYIHYNVLVGNLTAKQAVDATTVVASTSMTAPTFNGNATSATTATTCANKGFDIPHVKDSNKRIRHICVEGPESGIYVRGRLTDSNIINLPEYWYGLIDPATITVTLTQIASSQDLIVDSIPWGKSVVIKSGNGTSIDCFYEVWAARWLDRKDHSKKLHVVYEGTSSSDYPGLNDDFVGVHYDNQNIIKHNEDIEL